MIPWREANRLVIPRSEATWESRVSSCVFAGSILLSGCVLRDCRVGLRPPRNDKPLAFTILMTACSLQRCSAGSGMPLPYKAYTIDDSATGFIACMAFRERRYTPFFGGCRFNGGRYRASVPFRDCHGPFGASQ